MVGIEGISGIRQSANTGRGEDRRQRVSTQHTAPHDEVQFSSDARRAEEISRLVAQVNGQSVVRAERVAEAKRDIEQGAYRLQSVVLQVAARVSGHVELSLA